MLVVETIAQIRRAHFVQGKSIKAICRELSISRKVVRKVLRSETTEFRYERERQPLPQLGPWQAELDRLLAANEAQAGPGAADADPGLRGSCAVWATRAATTQCGAMRGPGDAVRRRLRRRPSCR